MKERMAAIVIGGLLVFSVVGYAFIGMGRFGGSGEQQVQVPSVMNEYLSAEQVVSVLRTGRVLIRNVYTSDCTECMANDAVLEIFVNSFEGFAILEEVMIEPDNHTLVDDMGYVKFEMVSPTGEIQDLREVGLTQENLTEAFCEISAVKPRACLLSEIGSQPLPPSISSPATEPEGFSSANGTLNGTMDIGLNESDESNETNTTGIGNASA